LSDTENFVAGKRCLVLDDEFLIALDIQQILEAAGAASVVCVGSADEALEVLRKDPSFDVAVLDVKLSGPDGSSLNVAAALTLQGTAFVFLTGMRSDDVHTRNYPAVPVVEKPYDAQLLLAALRQALAKP
jgi:CheY-like chemotaxis protein